MQAVPVTTPSAGYTAHIGPGALNTLAQHARELAPRAARAALVIDANLPDATKALAADQLRAAGLDIATTELTPTEPHKSIETWTNLLQAFADHGLTRTDLVVALGGGIVGDTAGFAAAASRRGTPVIQCPTTLLAMVDASVGGKTGVNLVVPGPSGPEDAAPESRLLKNFVGAFHHPLAVIADTDTLSSLTPRHFACGLAECIKHTMIAGPFAQTDLGDWLDANLDNITAEDPEALTELVARNVRLKAAVVTTDEHETSTGAAGRALLNLGHTFAHAIETLPQLDLLHGEAVALGLVAAARYAKLTASADVEVTLHDRLTRAALPATVADLPPCETILDRMHDDKKVAAGSLRLVVPTGPTSSTVIADPDRQAVLEAINAIRS